MNDFISEAMLLPKNINWQSIAGYFGIGSENSNERNTWITQQQTIMQDRLMLMLHLELTDYKTTNWLFERTVGPNKNTLNLRVRFTPLDNSFIVQSNRVSTTKTMFKNYEWYNLQQLAAHYGNINDYVKLNYVKQRLQHIMAERRCVK
jgi:hypothetical protein